MNRRSIFAAFAVVCVAQLAVPATMIRTFETTLAEGRRFKVRCDPFNLNGAVQGRFVWLSLEIPAPRGYVPEGQHWRKTWWATLEEGEDGFARASAIGDEAPEGVPAVRVGYGGQPVDPETNRPGEPVMRLRLDRYYVSEANPASERGSRESLLGAGPGWYAIIRVLGSVAVIEDLYVAGMPIEEYIALPLDRRPQLPEPEAPPPLHPRGRAAPGEPASDHAAPPPR